MNFQVPQRNSRFLFEVWRTDQGLIGYVNSDYAVDLDRRRSLTGYVFTVGSCAAS